MTGPDSPLNGVIKWFREFVRPVFQTTEAPARLQELDRQVSQLEELEKARGKLYPVCLLGQAGVGKSTLVNTLIAGTEIVVPSGGGTGPLTASALRVVYGAEPSFVVEYHAKARINETRFSLEAQIERQSRGGHGADESQSETEPKQEAEELDSDEDKRARTKEAIDRACLLVAGAQTASRELTYLVDALRRVLDQTPKYSSELFEEDLERLRRVQEALRHGEGNSARRISSEENSEFRLLLRDHASGFLAPLIKEMTIHWPSPLLRQSLEIVDLPGIGVLRDVYESITADYLRNRARAVMLVVDSRGIRREDAELLKNSGFLNRFLHSSDDLTADPVALMVAVVKIDDVAVENWRNDKAINGTATKSKAEHFAEVAESCRKDIGERLHQFLKEVWEDDTEGKRTVIYSILENLQVFPVSAPQYRLIVSKDPDEDRPFLPNEDATNIVTLRSAIDEISTKCLAEQQQRREEASQRFLGQLRARLELLSAQRNEERQAEAEIKKFQVGLDAFIAPLRREYDARRGGFGNFLRQTIPTEIEAKVKVASDEARRAILEDVKALRGAHWKTLQAAVRREGTFYGSRHINLPHDFALRFEEPVAEVWSRKILVRIRSETKGFATYESRTITQVLDWARSEGMRTRSRLLEALVESVNQRRQKLNAVGKEAVDELRKKVRAELIKKIEPPIRRRCKKFVQDGMNSGRGVKGRILELFDELAEEVIDAASAPAARLLVERFREVEREILAAFDEQGDPLEDASGALMQRHEKRAQREDAQLSKSIEVALESRPDDTELVA